MNVKSTKYLIIALITFVILFFMNYLGNDESDKLYRALLTAGGGVVGLTIGLAFMNYMKKNDQPHDDFD